MSTSSVFDPPHGLQETFSKLITAEEASLYESLSGGGYAKEDEPPSAGRAEGIRKKVNPHFLVSIIYGLLHARLSNKGSQCITMHFEFLAPVFTGDQIDTVIEMTEFDAARRLVTFKADCYNQGRSQVLTGQTVMLVPA